MEKGTIRFSLYGIAENLVAVVLRAICGSDHFQARPKSQISNEFPKRRGQDETSVFYFHHFDCRLGAFCFGSGARPGRSVCRLPPGCRKSQPGIESEVHTRTASAQRHSRLDWASSPFGRTPTRTSPSFSKAKEDTQSCNNSLIVR